MKAMKPTYLIRISLIVCIVLLCTGFAVYSFMRLGAMDERRDFNLYTLIPQDAEAVFETGRVADLIERIDNMACSRDNHFLYASDLFSCAKRFLQVLMEEEPHGLSWDMNEMLISFHNPDLKNGQVLYCRLGEDDRRLLEACITRYTVSGYSSKSVDYKGQTIDIYPLADGRFLAVWMKRDFLAVSFQKRLLEQVIDTWKRKNDSLAGLDVFRAAGADRREEDKAVVYVRWNASSASSGAETGKPLWLTFHLKFAEEGIYCAGVADGDVTADTCRLAFLHSPPLKGFSGNELPASTILYKKYALSPSKTEIECLLRQMKADSVPATARSVAFDEALAEYFQSEAGSRMLSCSFLSGDSTDRRVSTVLSLTMPDVVHAQGELHQLLYTFSQGRYAFYKSFSAATGVPGLRLYRLPAHRLTARLAGYANLPSWTYACFYRGRLLLSPDEQGLSAYITAMEQMDVLGTVPSYEEATEKLAPVYHALVMADMAEVVTHSSCYRDQLPDFFLAHADFFRHFRISIQLCYVEGTVCPNLVFLYT